MWSTEFFQELLPLGQVRSGDLGLSLEGMEARVGLALPPVPLSVPSPLRGGPCSERPHSVAVLKPFIDFEQEDPSNMNENESAWDPRVT